MRSVCAKILTLGLVVLAASPAFAQQQGRQGRGGRGGFGGGAPSAAMLLNEPKVQEELKLTDDQKAEFKKISDKYREEMRQARQDQNNDKVQELRKAETADMDKAVASLKPEQSKRLKQLEVQAGGLAALNKEDVQTALKLTDAQKKSVKDAQEELTKDAQEMFQGAQGDRTKMTEIFTKIQGMRKDALEKAVSSFTPEQKTEWKNLTGEKFEFPAAQGGRRGGRRPGGNGTPPPSDK